MFTWTVRTRLIHSSFKVNLGKWDQFYSFSKKISKQRSAFMWPVYHVCSRKWKLILRVCASVIMYSYWYLFIFGWKIYSRYLISRNARLTLGSLNLRVLILLMRWKLPPLSTTLFTSQRIFFIFFLTFSFKENDCADFNVRELICF